MHTRQRTEGTLHAVNESLREKEKFPFPATLSLEPLIQYWEAACETGNEIDGLLALRVAEQLRLAPQLKQPLHDPHLLEQHSDLIHILMSALFPPALHQDIIGAAIAPHLSLPVYATPRYQELIGAAGSLFRGHFTLDRHSHFQNSMLFAGSLILKQCYGLDIMQESPVLFRLDDPQSNLERYYKSTLNTRFVRIKTHHPPKLNHTQFQRLIDHMEDVTLWRELLPSPAFSFEGLVVLNFIDVSEQALTSGLKHKLLSRDALTETENWRQVQHKLRSLLRMPELEIGLCLKAEEGAHWECEQLLPDGSLLTGEQPAGIRQYYEQVRRSGKRVILEDLRKHDPVFQPLLEKGFRNLLLAPLAQEGKFLGMLELAHPQPDKLNSLNANRLNELLPLFCEAVAQTRERLHQRVQRVIREKYVSIHPAVAWRFQQAAREEVLNEVRTTQTGSRDPILFREVYPLYGLSDIRNSSLACNQAMRNDLIQQLSLAQQVISEACQRHELPRLERLSQTIEACRYKLEQAPQSGDAYSALALIRSDINPAFASLHHDYPDLHRWLDLYRQSLDPDRGLTYTCRRAYGESLQLVNTAMTALLEEAQQQAQQIIPHYFAKTLTDGIAYNIYAGQSICPGQVFSADTLKQLRYWQLKTTCRIARLAAQLKPQMAVPMDLAHLILFHDQPIDIYFREDERQFDISGTFDLQYEIIKKRLDKARVQGREERLTQPGKLVLAFTHEHDIESVAMPLLNQLSGENYFSGDMEHLEVEALQGVRGLQALRIHLNLYGPAK